MESDQSKSGIYLRLFPLHVVLFPGMKLPLHIFEERYRQMIGECISGKSPFGIVLIKRGIEVGGPVDVHMTGTTARIEQVDRLPDGRMHLLAVGEHRFTIREVVQERPFLAARVTLMPGAKSARPGPETASLARATAEAFRTYDRLMQSVDDDWEAHEELPDDEEQLAYFIASTIPLPRSEKQALLSENDLDALLRHERRVLRERNHHHRSVLVVRKLIAQREKRYGPMPSPFRLN